MAPPTTFRLGQRLLRGYGPLAAFVVLLLLMSLFVPTKAPEAVNAGAFGPSSGTGTTSGSSSGDDGAGVTGSGTPGPGTAGAGSDAGDGGPGADETGGGNVAAASGVQDCADRDVQVTNDPYSPPCFSFAGDNGGETHRGIDAETIRVAFRVLDERGFQQTLAELAGASLTDSPETVRNTVAALAEYFSENFEFYGRRLEIVFYEGVGSNANELVGRGRAQAEADAETVNGLNVFADLSATSEPYADALCRRGVIALGTPYLSRTWHDQRGPCAWSLAVNGTEVAEFASEFVAKRLAGGSADFAGGSIQGQPRVIATLAPNNPWYQESVEFGRARYRELTGLEPGPNYQYLLDLAQLSNQASELIPRMKADGVTTVICGCDPIFPVFLSGVAAREDYFPEFVIAGTALTDADIVGQLWNQEFASHALGVSPLQDFVPPDQSIAYQAFKSVRPDEEPAFTVDLIYYQMYVLAIGVQMAGPNLTPDTFQRGLYDYPPMSGPIGLWDFGPGDHTTADDVREIYWDPNAISNYNGEPGAYIGVNNGARYLRDQLPSGPFPRPQ